MIAGMAGAGSGSSSSAVEDDDQGVEPVGAAESGEVVGELGLQGGGRRGPFGLQVGRAEPELLAGAVVQLGNERLIVARPPRQDVVGQHTNPGAPRLTLLQGAHDVGLAHPLRPDDVHIALAHALDGPPERVEQVVGAAVLGGEVAEGDPDPLGNLVGVKRLPFPDERRRQASRERADLVPVVVLAVVTAKVFEEDGAMAVLLAVVRVPVEEERRGLSAEGARLDREHRTERQRAAVGVAHLHR